MVLHSKRTRGDIGVVVDMVNLIESRQSAVQSLSAVNMNAVASKGGSPGGVDPNSGITAGNGISVTVVDQSTEIANTGVLSVEGCSGAIDLTSTDKSVTITPDIVKGTIDLAAKAVVATVEAKDVSVTNTWYVPVGGTTPADNVEDVLGVLNDVIAQTDSTGFLMWKGDMIPVVYSFDKDMKFCLQEIMNGFIQGKSVTCTATIAAPAITKDAMKANSTTFICYNEVDGLHAIDYTAVNDYTYLSNVVLFEVLNDGTNIVVVRENHPYHFPTYVSRYLHENLAIIIQGAGAILTAKGTTQIQIVGEDKIDDHGLEDTIPDSAGAAITINYYYVDGTSKWIRGTQSSTLPKKYNKTGTLTDLTKYGVFRIYVSKADDTVGSIVNYFAVYDTVDHSNLADARKAVANNAIAQADKELMALELAQLGFVIVNNTGAIADIIIAKSSLRGVYANNTTNQAKLVVVDVTNFDKTLSSADTTVQAALETLDDNTVDLVSTQSIKGAKTFEDGVVVEKAITSGVTGSSTGSFILKHKTAKSGDISFSAGDAASSLAFIVPNALPATDGELLACKKDGTMSWVTPTGSNNSHTYFVHEPELITGLLDETGYRISAGMGINPIINKDSPDMPRTLYGTIKNVGVADLDCTFTVDGIDANGDTVQDKYTITALAVNDTYAIHTDNAYITITAVTIFNPTGSSIYIDAQAGWAYKLGIPNKPTELIASRKYSGAAFTNAITFDADYGTIDLGTGEIADGNIYVFFVK